VLLKLESCLIIIMNNLSQEILCENRYIFTSLLNFDFKGTGSLKLVRHLGGRDQKRNPIMIAEKKWCNYPSLLCNWNVDVPKI
jgi:hypothetical protein